MRSVVLRAVNFSFQAVLLSFFFCCSLQAIEYSFHDEPIDVVIPAIEKDLATLNRCIAAIKKEGCNIRRVIVVSKKRLTDQAEWFSEELFPFKMEDIAYYICKMDSTAAHQFIHQKDSRCGWYFQQLLKFYASYVIPDISSNILLLDADTVFLKPTEFLNSQHAGLYNPGYRLHTTYFRHGVKLVPSFKRVFEKLSGISHHMIFQRAVLDHLFEVVESYHQRPFWQAFCITIDQKAFAGASEYEIYFNFVFGQTSQVELRVLRWADLKELSRIGEYQKKGYNYVSCHTWMREPVKLKGAKQMQ